MNYKKESFVIKTDISDVDFEIDHNNQIYNGLISQIVTSFKETRRKLKSDGCINISQLNLHIKHLDHYVKNVVATAEAFFTADVPIQEEPNGDTNSGQ